MRNKIILSVVLALLCYSVIVLINLLEIEVKNTDSKGKNIICFGDSITFGYGAESGEDYPTALAKMVKMPVINSGIDGDTTVEALKRLDSDVISRQPFLVIIEFAGNDFLRAVPKETTVNNIKLMVDKIQAKGAMVAIVDISAGMFLREYRLAFYNLARQKNTIFVPAVLSGIITNPSMKSDFLHPNGNGYKKIAERVSTAIKPYLVQEEDKKK